MSIQTTPQANRPHIGLFGRRNAGKSSLINALTGQEISLVSPVAGTTTDPVKKAYELPGFGPVVFLDTPGLDDRGVLGEMRVQRTRQAASEVDVAIFLFADLPTQEELTWLREFQAKGVPVLVALGQCDLGRDSLRASMEDVLGLPVYPLSAKTGEGVDALRRAIPPQLPENFWETELTGSLARKGDTVLLVMPQDIQAPKGRLILPQVQTLRELLDKGCSVLCCTADCLEETLQTLKEPPHLIITDSQVFPLVRRLKPEKSLLTSFSILFAGYKGSIDSFLQGAKALETLGEDARVLIAESCAHAPTEEDIGRVKIPALLRKTFGQGLRVDFAQGKALPDLRDYDLVIHCGACMVGRRFVLSRIQEAQEQGVPITNYGMTIAALTGILDEVAFP